MSAPESHDSRPRKQARSAERFTTVRPHFAFVLAALLAAGAVTSGSVHAAEANANASASTGATPMADAELERMLNALYADDAAARTAGAAAVAQLGSDAIPAIVKKLAEERKTPAAAVTAAIKDARGARGDSSGELDLGDALLKSGPASGDGAGAGYRTGVTTTALVRALAHIGTTPALRPMVRVAVDQGGAFRPEIARQIKALGDKAVPALIETRKESSGELRHWAYSQLEAMGKRVPGDAVQTKDNQVLADVLHAYATVHDMDALPVMLSFVNSDRIQVRGAARDALAEFGQDAIWKLREALANVTGKPAPEGSTAPEVRKELFAAYDRLRLQEVYGLLDDGLAREKDGKLEDAIAAFDKVLARQPMIERRQEMVPAYVAYAAQLEEADPAKALALYRKALRLWPETPRGPQIEAEIAYLEGMDLLAHGIADAEPFERALRLDSTHRGARSELTRLETNVEEREERVRAFAAAAAVVVVAILGILLFGGRRTRRRASPAT